MSKKNRRKFTAEFKAKVALEALKGIEPIHAIAARYEVHPVQVSAWKKELLERLPGVFATKAPPGEARAADQEARLYQKIGQLEVELDWLKKNLRSCTAEKRTMIEPKHRKISVRRQCELLALPRASLYYVRRPESDEDLRLMREIDELHLLYPFFGSRQIVRRLMRLLGLEAIYRKPNLSRANPAHRVYPYLLRDLTVDRPDQVWATDITYIPVQGGFAYLCAVIDWHSRCVLAWELSNTLDASFCVRAVKRAMQAHGTPEIFNTDQGCQFTSAEFTTALLERGVKLSMDGKGRCLDNVFVERLWRSVKYEEVYLKSYASLVEAERNLAAYFRLYNEHRPHSTHDGKTPSEIHHHKVLPQQAA
jgi:putative transposase